jgi:LPS O-antigen subunit length determinant protein (WzzB/FepE family)
MEDRTAPDEITLRDLYLVLRRWWVFILGMTLGAALVALAVSLALTKKFESKGVYSLNLLTDKMAAPLNNLPALPGLAQGYGDSLGTTVLAAALGESEPGKVFAAKFDEKRGLWTLTGEGSTPALARERADRLMQSARAYLEDRIAEGVKVNVAGAREQARLDLSITEQSLARISQVLASTPQISNRDGATTAGLEGQGVGPQAARSNNPAYVTLAVQQSQLKAQRAQSQARVQTYTDLLKDPARLKVFAGQVFSVQTISAPTEPLDSKSPQPLLYAVIAGIVGLFLGLLLPFVFESIRDPEADRNDTKRALRSAAD